MSPTALAVLDRPETADYGLLTDSDFVRYQVIAYGRVVESARSQPGLLDLVHLGSWDRKSAHLSFSPKWDLWTATSHSSLGPVERFVPPYAHIDESEVASYLFEDSLPEVVPAEWVLELERYRSVEHEDFVLPWNEDPPRGDAGD